MIKIGHVEEVNKIEENIPQEIIESIEDLATILDNEYGVNRDIDRDNGGYVLVIQDKNELPELHEIYIDVDDLIPEYTDVVRCSNEEVWINSLILMNNDFGVSLIMPIEIAPQTLLNQICEVE